VEREGWRKGVPPLLLLVVLLPLVECVAVRLPWGQSPSPTLKMLEGKDDETAAERWGGGSEGGSTVSSCQPSFKRGREGGREGRKEEGGKKCGGQ